MNPEPAESLTTARQHLKDAKTIRGLDIAHVAAREAYLAAFHAAEAFIHDRTGRVVKTHSGLRTLFARLAKDEPNLDPAFTQFLANAYDLKSLADYADKPVERISTQDADLAIETAERFIAAIEELINP
ncbi:MAG TPA: HEPN domain-containing protein [Acetobacteraceae bacterium]|nr:HEPN domain-containing protein [Acetobacteraceae bacterium]